MSSINFTYCWYCCDDPPLTKRHINKPTIGFISKHFRIYSIIQNTQYVNFYCRRRYGRCSSRSCARVCATCRRAPTWGWYTMCCSGCRMPRPSSPVSTSFIVAENKFAGFRKESSSLPFSHSLKGFNILV